MRKKLPLILLCVLIFIQICVPVGMLTYHTIDTNIAEAKGEKFRFRVDNISCWRDGYIHFSVSSIIWNPGKAVYGNIIVDEEGYATLDITETKPEHNNYVKSSAKDSFYFPVDYVRTKEYPNIDYMLFYQNYSDTYTPTGIDHYYNEAYLEAYVYKGRVGNLILYIDGLEAEEYFSNLNTKIGLIQ